MRRFLARFGEPVRSVHAPSWADFITAMVGFKVFGTHRDLRDGWGGAIPEYLDLFNTRAPTMQVTDRNGASEFENVKWRKPVAMLVNGGTRSGKEILAYGFKKYRLGEVIGSRTEGAVLAATAFLVGGGLLLLAVEDVRVDGERLEGVGVAPTIEVQAEPASVGLGDPQLNRAIAVLSGA
jgi:carboxyl-terminal processing protease